MTSRSALRPLALIPFTLLGLMPLRAENPPTAVPTPPSPVWSDPRPGVTPKGATTIHGPYLAEPVTVRLEKLPAHKWVRLKFNLIVLGSWDGSSPVWGPDLWTLQVRGAQRLYCATFSNMGEYNGNDPQSFPDDYPWLNNRAWTGASARDSLGFARTSGFSTGRDLNDATYPVETLFPHDSSDLTLDFMGNYGDPRLSQQSWAVSDFSCELLGEIPAPKPDELADLWQALGDTDAVAANRAFQTLVAGGATTHAFLSDRVAELTSAAEVPGEADARRLYRAHKLARVLAGEHTSDLCFRIEKIIPEYHAKTGAASCDTP